MTAAVRVDVEVEDMQCFDCDWPDGFDGDEAQALSVAKSHSNGKGHEVEVEVLVRHTVTSG